MLLSEQYCGLPWIPRGNRAPSAHHRHVSAGAAQEEPYFTVSLEAMDICLLREEYGISRAALTTQLGVEESRIKRMYAMIDFKWKAARYLHATPVLVP
jgi:NAD+ synthase